MAPKLRKFDCETEDPWAYMADLPLEHASTMRRYVFLHCIDLLYLLPSHYPSISRLINSSFLIK